MPKRTQGYMVSVHRPLSCSGKNKGNLEDTPVLGLWKSLMGTGKLCREKNLTFLRLVFKKTQACKCDFKTETYL